jgi:hypothetical protein
MTSRSAGNVMASWTRRFTWRNHGRHRAYGVGGMLRSGDDALAAVDSDLKSVA